MDIAHAAIKSNSINKAKTGNENSLFDSAIVEAGRQLNKPKKLKKEIEFNYILFLGYEVSIHIATI